MKNNNALSPKNFDDYQLLDSGKGKKLERFGDRLIVRPEAKAIWKPVLARPVWEQANAEFVDGDGSGWKIRDMTDNRWMLNYSGLKFWCEIERSKQVGVFPENSAHWSWIAEQINSVDQKPKVLNLFGYTGIASLAAAKAGADVTHIDSSKRAVGLGKDAQIISGLDSSKIRWIVEDAVRFVQREIKRGNYYDALILDPPMFGLGPKKERWEFFKHFLPFCEMLRELLSENPLFVVITAYAKDMDERLLEEGIYRMRLPAGKETYGELVLQEKSAGRRISMSNYGQWAAK